MTNRTRSAREAAYAYIRRQILTLELPGGQKIDEPDLVRSIGFSRTPVREALHQLASEGLVTVDPGGGHRVSVISLRQCRELIQAQYVLVRATSQLLVDQIDEAGLDRLAAATELVERAAEAGDIAALTQTNAELHILETELAGNSYLLAMAERVYTHLQRLAHLSFGGGDAPLLGAIEEHYRKVCRDHREHLKALRAGDRARVEEIAVRHVRLFQTRLAGFLATSDLDSVDFSSLASEARMP